MVYDCRMEKFDSRLKMILYFLKGCKRYFIAFLFFACLMSLFDLIPPQIISFTVDSVLDSNQNPWIKEHLYVVSLLVIGVALLGAIWRYLFRYFNSKGAEKLVHRMRNTLFDHLMHLPYGWYSQNQTGDLIQRCTSDVEQIKTFLAEQLTTLFRVILLVSLALYFMFSIDGKMALCALAFIPIIVGYSILFYRGIANQFEKVDIEEGRLSNIAQENLTGVRVVRAFGKEMSERKKFEKQNKEYTALWVHLMRLMALFWTSSDLFSYLQVIVVLCVGVWQCVNGNITAGEFIAFNSYTAMIIWPIRSLGRVISNLSKAGISIDRLRYIMNAEVEVDSSDARDIDMYQDITFDHVCFKYENSTKNILDDVSFKIEAGKTVGILGATGSGKSTLMYLLDRLYDVSSGNIYVGDTNLKDIRLDCVRKNIGIVLQEPYLFSRTLEENIRIADEGVSHEDVLAATKIAALESTISHFQNGFETYIGERGVTLSGGQKQRTAIAQMLVRNADIMIFDDSLSAVDANTDQDIRTSLSKVKKECTTLLIAHRITTLMDADLILVLDHGKIVQQGNHKSLLKEDGIYKRIYELQSRNCGGETDEI